MLVCPIDQEIIGFGGGVVAFFYFLYFLVLPFKILVDQRVELFHFSVDKILLAGRFLFNRGIVFMDGEFDSITLEIGKGVDYCAIFEVIPGWVVAYLVVFLIFHL